MWLCLNDAFFSVVDKARDPNCLVVRARRPGDIERHFPDAAVRRTDGNDYLFRAEIPRDQIAARVAELIKGIDYSNFKASVGDASLHAAYGRVWGTMSTLQPVAPYSRSNAGQGDLL